MIDLIFDLMMKSILFTATSTHNNGLDGHSTLIIVTSPGHSMGVLKST